MSWLKTVGQDILKGISIATAIAQGIDPLIQNTSVGSKVAAVTSELSTIGNVVTIVESTANAVAGTVGTGPQKLAAALPYVSSLVQSSELLVGKQIQDEAAFENGCSLVINGVVMILNSLKPAKVSTTQATPPPPPPPVVPPPPTVVVSGPK